MARIIIDAGHGGSERAGNSSACGARGATGVVEKDVTLDIAKHVITRLGGAAALTRTGDRNMTLGARAVGVRGLRTSRRRPRLARARRPNRPRSRQTSRSLQRRRREAARRDGGAEPDRDRPDRRVPHRG
jgi:hypothetical protein